MNVALQQLYERYNLVMPMDRKKKGDEGEGDDADADGESALINT